MASEQPPPHANNAADRKDSTAANTTAAVSKAKARKRAPKACLSCRSRKVRCDVSQRGRPCMNCHLDNEACVVTGRASRVRPFSENQATSGSTQAQPRTEASFPPYNNERNMPEFAFINDKNSSHQTPRPQNNDTSIPRGSGPSSREGPQPPPSQHHHSPPLNTNKPQAPFSQFDQFSNNTFTHPSSNATPGLTTQPPPPPSSTQWTSDLNTDVTYSYYPFLFVGNLPNILPQDVNYLEHQGCLRVPTRTILDEFVQQYFLHVHPMMPIINEGDFWDMYCSNDGGESEFMPTQRMSLLVFQAMLFASCSFVSRHTIKALGFPSIRAARSALYRRAKLLHDLEGEASPAAIAQAALLLTFWAPPFVKAFKKPNTAWLVTAIQHAKTAGAHHYANLSTPAPPAHASFSSQHQQQQYFAQAKKQNMLKRLWWCCVTRDKIMSLGLRRPVNITGEHFDFNANSILGFADLADEVQRSRVYNPETKRCLAEILEQLTQLCVILTDILIIVFPQDDSPGWGREMRAKERQKLQARQTALRTWFQGATMRFPPFGGGSMARMSTSKTVQDQHESVILYTNLMYMYYHSTRVVLSHHEVLNLSITATAPTFTAIPPSNIPSISETRQELQDAAAGVTECLKELIHLRLARWLPISAVACTALPLTLHILDAKLSSQKSLANSPSNSGNDRSPPNVLNGDSNSAMKQNRLNILIEAMKTYQQQYDGVDWISGTVKHIINITQLDPPGGGDMAMGNDGNGGSAIAGWTDILATHPSTYLRLTLTMDFSLSKGRLPEDNDFPMFLRGLFKSGLLRSLRENQRRQASDTALYSQPVIFAHNSFAHASHSFTGSQAGHFSHEPAVIDFENEAFRPSTFGYQTGTVTAISSSESDSSTSPASAEDTNTNSSNGRNVAGTDSTASPSNQQLAREFLFSPVANLDHAMSGIQAGEDIPSEGVVDLATEIMSTFPMDEESPETVDGGAGSGFVYAEGSDHEGTGSAGDWMDDMWEEIEKQQESEDRQDGRKSERDPAKALMEAFRSPDPSEVLAC